MKYKLVNTSAFTHIIVKIEKEKFQGQYSIGITKWTRVILTKKS